MRRFELHAIGLFPLAAISVSFAAWWAPDRAAVVPLLTVILLGMGMTLRWSDYARAVRSGQAVAVGVG